MASKDYSKYKKPQLEGNESSDGNQKNNSAYDIKTPFRSDPKGIRFERVPIQKLVHYRNNTTFDSFVGTPKFETLVREIKEVGILQPIIVRETEDGNYEIIAGGHRTEAAKILNLAVVPATVYPLGSMSDNLARQTYIITNVLHREGMNFREKVRSLVEYESTLENQQGLRSDRTEGGVKYDRYQQLTEVFKIGNKTTTIQYLKAGKEMPEDILDMVNDNKTPFTVAYRIMTQPNAEFREELYNYIRQGNKLTIKMLDDLITEFNNRSKNVAMPQEMPETHEVQDEQKETSAVETPYDGFQTIMEFNTGEATEPTAAVKSNSAPPSNQEIEAKAPTMNASEFDTIINKRKKKKLVTLKVEKEKIPARFLSLDDSEKSNLIISLLRSWEKEYYGEAEK